MRRVAGLVLTGLGTFFIVLALLMRFYLPDQVVKFPLNWYSVTTLVGHNMTYFSPKEFKQLSGVTMRAMSTLKGDVAAGSSSTAVWNQVTGVEDITNHLPAQYSSQRAAFDRRTGVLVNCCGAHVNGATRVPQSGQGYVWPIGPQQQTYEVFNSTLLRPAPAVYQGTATVNGRTTYKYAQQITDQKIGTLTVPGSLVGFSQTSVTLPEYYTATNTYWVDPVTGVPLNISQDQTQWLTDAAGATRLLLFQGTLNETPASTQNIMNLTNSYRQKAIFVQDIGPLVSVLLGIVLLVAGIILFISAAAARQYAYGEEEGSGGRDDQPGGPDREVGSEQAGSPA